ncbi:MAG TPA: CAP domain-containing protein [Thermoleophilaceae bacterium]
MGVHRLVALAAAAQLALLAFCATTAAASDACPDDLTRPTMATAYAAAMSIVCDMNVYRAQNGLRPLNWDWRLWSSAQGLASDMAARSYAAHVTPEGRVLADRVAPTGYIPSGGDWWLAENLGWGTSYLSTPLAIVLGWLDSPEHRENMLDPGLRDVGVGIAEGAISENGRSGIIYVADFGMRVEPVVTVRPRGRAHRARRR